MEMITNEQTYQSVLFKLSRVPVGSLAQIDAFLENFMSETQTKRQNREAILALAGSWNEMSESDFAEYLSEAKRSGGEMFSRDITL